MSRSDPSPSFRFHVEIEGIEVARFSECSGVEVETKTFDYQEGGLNDHVHRFPANFSYSNLALKRGIASDGINIWNWIKGMLNGQIVTHDVTVTLYDVGGLNPLRTWTFKDAYPIKWSAGTFSAEQSVIAFESLTLAHQGMLLN
jgi:phage tail-like protein